MSFVELLVLSIFIGIVLLSALVYLIIKYIGVSKSKKDLYARINSLIAEKRDIEQDAVKHMESCAHLVEDRDSLQEALNNAIAENNALKADSDLEAMKCSLIKAEQRSSDLEQNYNELSESTSSKIKELNSIIVELKKELATESDNHRIELEKQIDEDSASLSKLKEEFLELKKSKLDTERQLCEALHKLSISEISTSAKSTTSKTKSVSTRKKVETKSKTEDKKKEPVVRKRKSTKTASKVVDEQSSTDIVENK